jgi:hypothetical protein
MPITFPCACGQQLRVDDELAGKRVRCPGCQQILNVPSSTAPAAPTVEAVYGFKDEAPSSPPPMPGQRGPTSGYGGRTKGSSRRPGGRNCHEIDYEIFGDDLQLVEVELDPGETVIAEAGAMATWRAASSSRARWAMAPSRTRVSSASS